MPAAAALSGFAASMSAAAKRRRDAYVPVSLMLDFFKNDLKCIQSVGVNVGGVDGLKEIVVLLRFGNCSFVLQPELRFQLPLCRKWTTRPMCPTL